MTKKVDQIKKKNKPVTILDNEVYTIICKDKEHSIFASMDLIEIGLQNLSSTLSMIDNKYQRKAIVQNFINNLNKCVFDINK
jgi:hypothetical protein